MTYLGKLTEEGIYELNYPGITIFFPIPEKYQKLYMENKEMPIELPDGSSPIATKLEIYKGHDNTKPSINDFSTDGYFQKVTVILGKGLKNEEKDYIIQLNDTPQDVMSALGTPDGIFYRHSDKLKIHKTSNENEVEILNSIDYFYNYFELGIDVMFDGSSHTVKNIILRTSKEK
jgi:hypothetical protein